MSTIDNFFAKIYIAGLFGIFSVFSFAGEESSSLAVFIFPILYLYSLIKFSKIKFYKRDRKTLVLFIYMFSGLLLTTIFSYNFVGSLLSVICLMFNFIFAVWLAKKITLDQFFLIILKVLKYTLIVSMILLLIKPEIVVYIDPLDRDSIIGLPNIKGLFPHKIHAGIYCVVGYILADFFYNKTKYREYIVLKIAFFIAVLATGSSLGFSVLILLISIPAIIKFQIKTSGTQGLMFFIFFFTFIIFFLFYLGVPKDILTALGRDVTLTGRVPIWEFGLDYIKQHPFFGGGFKTFFDDVPNSPAQKLWAQSSYYNAPSFHNGYIEIIAESGIIGSFAFIVVLFKTVKKVLQIEDYISFSLLLIWIVANFAAALLIKQNMFFIVFLFFLNIKLFSANKEKRINNYCKDLIYTKNSNK